MDSLLRKPENQECVPMEPGSAQPASATVMQRVQTDYLPRHQRFALKQKSFTQQYSHIYTKRLYQLRPLLQQRARREWGDVVPIADHIIDLVEGQDCIVIGTTYKDMKLKPSVLDEFLEERGISGAMKPLEGITSDDDALVLEDDSGRVKLVNHSLDVHTIVTGVTIAIRGATNHLGEFEVASVCACDWLEQPARPLNPPDAYVMLVSGLEVGTASSEAHLLSIQLMADIVTGRAGGSEDYAFMSKITRVIIAGNSICGPEPQALRDRYMSAKKQEDIVGPVRHFDVVLSQLLSSVPVDLMPGGRDPTNYAMPQQPLHPALLAHSARYNTLNSVTNPYECSIGGTIFLGTSGQSLDDIQMQTRYSQSSDTPELLALENTLRWAHLCPTAPDTLACYPFYTEDPFVIEQCPHVFFAGNQDKFSTSLLEGPDGQCCRCICVPKFSTSRQAVLVELNTLHCFTLNCSADTLSKPMEIAQP